MRAYTRPLWLSGTGADAQVCRALEALPLRSGTAPAQAALSYDEAWLQNLLHAHPTLLPIEAIEPAFWPAVPICTELPLKSGFADNLLLTPDGGIVVVEAKLWRNPQARREVVGQILDYAKDLSALDYEGFQAAVRLALKDRSASLHQLASAGAGDGLDERTFVDAVSRNLRLGRFLLLICGDGIQEGVEELTGFLQRHMGLNFTLGLVELSLWRDPQSAEVLVQPRVVVRTTSIERAVVRVEEGVALRGADLLPAPTATSKSTTLTEEAFYDAMEVLEIGLGGRLKEFLLSLEPYRVIADVRKNLSLKWQSPEGGAFHLGSIYQNGEVGTDFVQWSTDTIGRIDIGTSYQRQLVRFLPGSMVKETPKETGWRVVMANGANPQISALLDHQDAWRAAIYEFVSAATNALAAVG